MKKIINLTQHKATPEQQAAGVVDLPPEYREKLVELLTFNELPDCIEISRRATEIADIAEGYIEENEIKNPSFMIGGALWLMHPLIEELGCIGEPLFAFSKRVVLEETQPDGSVIKKSVFKHQGFVPAC
jgi:hypothetical protein